jgi:hypothetical protein
VRLRGKHSSFVVFLLPYLLVKSASSEKTKSAENLGLFQNYGNGGNVCLKQVPGVLPGGAPAEQYCVFLRQIWSYAILDMNGEKPC